MIPALLILLLWIVPGIIAVFVGLKGQRDERAKYNGDKLYNTVGDLAFSITMGLLGIVGLLATTITTYEDVIIKHFNKRL